MVQTQKIAGYDHYAWTVFWNFEINTQSGAEIFFNENTGAEKLSYCFHEVGGYLDRIKKFIPVKSKNLGYMLTLIEK